MKKATTYFLLLFVVVFCSMTPKKPISKNVNPKKETEILETVLSIIKTRHIVTKKFDDDFSKKMFKSYIDSLDRTKLFLLQSDIEEFKQFETKLDDHLKTNDLTFFFMTYDRVKLRMSEAKEIYTSILKNKLDFTKNTETEFSSRMETAETNKIAFCKNKKELEKKWDSFLKTILFERIKNRTKAKTDATDLNQIDYVLDKESQTLESYIGGTLFDYDSLTREIIFQHFINAILVQFDNYSKYYNPVTRNEYLTKLSGKVEGVGISMQFINNNCQVIKLSEGGPAWKSKKFEIGDEILKVAQDKQSPVNVVGFNPFEVTKLLKGDVGTIVKITIKKANGKIEDITLKRGLVSMNDSYIKSCIVKKNKVTYGIISVPRFYNDIEDEDARNTAKDFAKELEILKREGVKALIVDLRNNNGGDLEAAAKIIGNFVTKSPLAQFKSREQNVSTIDSENIKRVWGKNAVIIVNKKTASESELIISAFKEHNIGIVVGAQTKGNSTTQEYVNLNEFRTNKLENTDMGALVFSSRKFYKLNGTSVQRKGIVPDVSFFEANKKDNENYVNNEVDIEDVKAITFVPNNKNDFFATAIKNSMKRNNESANLKNILKKGAFDAKIASDLRNIRTLNNKKFFKQLQEVFKEEQKLEPIVYDKTIEFNLTPEAIKLIKDKEYLATKRNKWLENMTLDYQVHESLNILEEVLFAK